MRRIVLLGIALSTLMSACKKSPQEAAVKMVYPATQTVVQEDEYFGTKVEDPYRWLEDDNSKETAQWVTAQNTVTTDYLNRIPFRKGLRERLEKLWNYEKYSAPFKKGNHYFFFKNDGLQNQSVLYIQQSLDKEPEVFLDPNKLSTDGTVAISSLSLSSDGKYLGYSIARSGSDWQEIYIMDVATKQLLSDKINWAKFTGIAWRGNGFYYSRYAEPKKGDEFKSSNQYHKVYYHKIGTPQQQDQLVYEDKKNPNTNFYASVTEDERFLVLNASEGTSGNALHFMDLSKPNPSFVTAIGDFKSDHSVINNDGADLLVVTNLNAPNKRLVRINTASPAPAQWKDVIAEQKNVLQNVNDAGNKLFAFYMVDAQTRVYQYDFAGKQEREVKLPALGTAFGFSGEKEDSEVFYTFTSFTFPNTIYRYNLATGQSTLFRQPKVDFNPADYETKQVFYTSKDGTKVPMFIVHKKGIELNGNNPTYLYAYGGFNISLTPNFSVKPLLWLENGGIYAVPNLRGGSEYGEKWHKDGMLDKKQNVFDDFIAAAEYLIANKYTSKDKLAIAGGSNGGLLVGATMTQRPDLCKVALPAVGVLDMLRFHKFTIGRAWIVEYGCADSSKTQFETLLKYSPLHNIKKGTEYPATMVSTGDHDDRVVPAHSFKFISELQAKHRGENPVLIRVDVNAGHGAGKPTYKSIEEWADIMSFTFYNMQVDPFAGKKIDNAK